MERVWWLWAPAGRPRQLRDLGQADSLVGLLLNNHNNFKTLTAECEPSASTAAGTRAPGRGGLSLNSAQKCCHEMKPSLTLTMQTSTHCDLLTFTRGQENEWLNVLPWSPASGRVQISGAVVPGVSRLLAPRPLAPGLSLQGCPCSACGFPPEGPQSTPRASAVPLFSRESLSWPGGCPPHQAK